MSPIYRFVSDDSAVVDLVEQINCDLSQITADGTYDKNPVYAILSGHFADADYYSARQ